MRILVTNDDGVGAPGLASLAEALGSKHEAWILAPDMERSAVSHAATLGSHIKIRALGDRIYSCSGTPADCVVLALLGAIGFVPDAIVSGVNRGPNLGTDILYSGTCAAAREAALNGVPGIAVSCATRAPEIRYGMASSFVLRNLESLVEACSGEAFVNVNSPSGDGEPRGALWCDPCRRSYGNQLVSFDGPDGFSYCFITGPGAEDCASAGGEGAVNDAQAVAAGMVAVSRILVHPQAPAPFAAGRALI
jgi:5'-nucleotidase